MKRRLRPLLGAWQWHVLAEACLRARRGDAGLSAHFQAGVISGIQWSSTDHRGDFAACDARKSHWHRQPQGLPSQPSSGATELRKLAAEYGTCAPVSPNGGSEGLRRFEAGLVGSYGCA